MWWQLTRINNSPMSRFVSVLVQPKVNLQSFKHPPSSVIAWLLCCQEDGSVEPTMWQATDQAVALHRDRIFQKPQKPDFCAVRVADKNNKEDFVAPVIYKGQESDEVDVAFLQVDGTVTVQAGQAGFLQRTSFPTRLFLGKDPSINELRNELRRHQGLAWPELLSDFNLLVFLAGLPELKDDMQLICNAVANGTSLNADVEAKLQGYMPGGGGGGGGGGVPGMNFGGGAPASAPAPAAGGGSNAELKAQLLAMGCDEQAIATVIAAGVTDIEAATAILFG